MSIYQAAYDKLVESHKHLKEEWKPVGSGLERHRIVPGHQGGEYVDSNCTYLTRKQHILAHWLLWKTQSHIADFHAWKLMQGMGSSGMKGKRHSKITKSKMSQIRKGRKFSKEHKRNLSKSQIGRKHTPETISKLKEKFKERGEEWKRKVGEAAKKNGHFKHLNLEQAKCPHCNKEGQRNAMKRWHFDNCRYAT